MNAITSVSSNSTTRVLILWRVILPASAHRKIVLGQTPSRLATDFALLNFRTVTPPKGLSDSAGDFEFVDIVGFMRSFRSVCNCASPPNSRQAHYRENGSVVSDAASFGTFHAP